MKLDENNFLVFAMHNYDNPQCHSLEEFEDDLKRFYYLKKLFSRYKADGIVRERLVLNHIIVLYNLFGTAATNMLFYKINKEDWPLLATFLVYLNRMPDYLDNYNVRLSDLKLDDNIIKILRNL